MKDVLSSVSPARVLFTKLMRRTPKPGEKALVIGQGTQGLGTLMSIRALQPDCHVTVLARFPFQADMCRRCAPACRCLSRRRPTRLQTGAPASAVACAPPCLRANEGAIVDPL